MTDLNKLYVSICILSLLSMLCLLPIQPSMAQQESSGFTISMPVEYVNYTIVSIDGCLWAKIDGTYPMYIKGDVPNLLPMVYPTPPQTTNIHMYLDDKELTFTNYTETEPFGLHHTAIGDWEMVATTISPVTKEFTLGIHYEHPLQAVNGSHLFLYDLNISPYLSPENQNSTAYFTVRIEANVTDVKAFTTETDSKWNPINYTLKEAGDVKVVSVVMFSEYDKPLLGDLVVEFSWFDEVPEYPVLALIIVFVAVSCSLFLPKNG
ncbi:MAG: hypothetical protein ACFCUE_15125 [Candidatus Bathyarchaeia archaeon]